jgi:asparagine synthase (glutamine-hydrolysing)
LVIRDCSGKLPCYYLKVFSLYVFFADIRDIQPLGLRFTLNTDYLALYIFQHPLHVRETGLREVSALLAGDSVSISPAGTSHQCLWDPRSISRDNVINDYTRAESELTSVTEEVIYSWGSLYDRILLRLSGGLDSAIVLGCLKRLKCADRVVCVNEYATGTDDERMYAREAAETAGVPLIELPRVSDPAVFVHTIRRIPPDPTPDISKTVRMAALDSLNELAQNNHCDTVWTGQGGDHVFMALATAYPAVDFVMQHCLPLQLPSVLYDSAILSRQSIWSVLGQVLRYTWPRRTVPPSPFDYSGVTLMSKAAVAGIAEKSTTTPWRIGTGRFPPGKQTQIDLFFDLLNRHKPLMTLECPYECHPLISQPLLELSLRIPTYHLLRGGQQRAMARAAFADRIPLCIRTRDDKGSTRDQIRALIRGSGEMLRETLLEGKLVSLGILDRRSLERIIVTQETYKPTDVFALLGCIAIEMWATHWTTNTAEFAAE